MSRNEQTWSEPIARSPRDFVDARIYSDEGIFAEERERVLKRTWKFACHVSEISEIGDYRTIRHAGFPLIVARGEDGAVRTFINSCSHRSALVLTGPSGNARHWTCKFHGWTYNSQGDCTGIPRADAYDGVGVCAENAGLREVRTAVRLGMVFINLDEDATGFDDYAGDALESLAPIMGADQELEVFHIHRSTLRANWKQWQETQMETYHEYLHYLNRHVSFRADNYFDRLWKVYPGGHGTLEPLRHKYEEIKGWDERSENTLPGLGPNEARLVDLFPDTSIHCRATVGRIDTTIPVAPGVTIVERRGLGIKGESAADRARRVHHHNQFWGPFGRNHPEDCLAVEWVEDANRDGAARFSLIARHEDLKAQDDEMMRAYYDAWGGYMGRAASDLQQTAHAAE